jgi:hypothetical protein
MAAPVDHAASLAISSISPAHSHKESASSVPREEYGLSSAGQFPTGRQWGSYITPGELSGLPVTLHRVCSYCQMSVNDSAILHQSGHGRGTMVALPAKEGLAPCAKTIVDSRHSRC